MPTASNSFVLRWGRRVAGIALPALLAACADGVAPTAPTAIAVLDRDDRRPSPIEQFALAQQTYCNDAADLACSAFTQYDIGYIWCNTTTPNPDALYYCIDIGGGNARWWARHRPFQPLPKYSIEGSVRESRHPDGRRRLRISATVKNTLTYFDHDFYDGEQNYLYTERLLGASFLEYPGVDPDYPDHTLHLVDIKAEIDLLLPADFHGMPDLTQMVLDPAPGMALLRLDVRTETVGRIEAPYGDIPAGSTVRIRVNDTNGFALTPALDYPGPEFQIERVRGDRNDRDDKAEHADRYERHESRQSQARRGRRHD